MVTPLCPSCGLAKGISQMDEDHYVERLQLDEFEFDFENIHKSIDFAYKRRCETHIATWGNGEV